MEEEAGEGEGYYRFEVELPGGRKAIVVIFAKSVEEAQAKFNPVHYAFRALWKAKACHIKKSGLTPSGPGVFQQGIEGYYRGVVCLPDDYEATLVFCADSEEEATNKVASVRAGFGALRAVNACHIRQVARLAGFEITPNNPVFH
jgi:hypothetical protein